MSGYAPDIVSLAMGLRRESGEVTFEDLFGDFEGDTTDLAALWLWWDEYRLAAQTVEKAINAELTARLGEGSVEVAGYRVFVSKGRKDEKCIDHAGFHAWLRSQIADNPDLVERLVNPDTVRKGQLHPTVRQTFFEEFRRESAKREAIAVPSDRIEESRMRRELTERAVAAKEESDAGA